MEAWRRIAVVTSSEHLKHRLDYEVGKGLTNLEHIGRSVATREVAFLKCMICASLCICSCMQVYLPQSTFAFRANFQLVFWR